MDPREGAGRGRGPCALAALLARLLSTHGEPLAASAQPEQGQPIQGGASEVGPPDHWCASR
jgi:hypothetical protein